MRALMGTTILHRHGFHGHNKIMQLTVLFYIFRCYKVLSSRVNKLTYHLHTSRRNSSGFTIVELLIVVVVIAILAAISIVAYTGIQNRANDSAAQSDITNFAKKIQLYYAEYGAYPDGNNTGAPTGIGNFPVARASYQTSGVHNFIYCKGTVAGEPVFSVGAVSKSYTRYYFSSLTGGMQTYEGNWGSVTPSCSAMLPGLVFESRSYGFNTDTQTWFSWTQ